MISRVYDPALKIVWHIHNENLIVCRPDSAVRLRLAAFLWNISSGKIGVISWLMFPKWSWTRKRGNLMISGA